MPHRNKHVCPKAPIGKAKLQGALAAAWSRVSHEIGRGTFADATGADPTTINRAICGPSLPSAEHLLNSLCADPSALDEVLKLYGLTVRPLHVEAANDMETVAGVSHLAGQWAGALSDGVRDHRETCQIADAIRPLMPRLMNIVAEADRLKEVA